MHSDCFRQEATRARTLAELEQLLEQTSTDILLAYLPVVRLYRRASPASAKPGAPHAPPAPPARPDRPEADAGKGW